MKLLTMPRRFELAVTPRAIVSIWFHQLEVSKTYILAASLPVFKVVNDVANMCVEKRLVGSRSG
jgi:hypothetical protein